MVRSGVFSDEVWAVVEPVLPSDRGRRGKRWSEHRRVLEGIAVKEGISAAPPSDVNRVLDGRD